MSQGQMSTIFQNTFMYFKADKGPNKNVQQTRLIPWFAYWESLPYIAHFPLSHHLYGTHCLWTLDVVTLFSHLRTCWRLIYITKRIYIDFMLLQIIHYICMFFVFQCLRLGIVHRLDWLRIINALLLLLSLLLLNSVFYSIIHLINGWDLNNTLPKYCKVWLPTWCWKLWSSAPHDFLAQ